MCNRHVGKINNFISFFFLNDFDLIYHHFTSYFYLLYALNLKVGRTVDQWHTGNRRDSNPWPPAKGQTWNTKPSALLWLFLMLFWVVIIQSLWHHRIIIYINWDFSINQMNPDHYFHHNRPALTHSLPKHDLLFNATCLCITCSLKIVY